MARVIAVCGWERFQHYKDRDPPWVKLYRDLLTSESWVLGTDLSRLVQVASTLLAARYSNAIPYEFRLIRKVASLDCTESEFDAAIAHLEAHKFLQVHEVAPSASTTLAPRQQSATSETEKRQSREETEAEQNARAKREEFGEEEEGEDVPRGTFAKVRDCYPPGLYGDNDWLLAEREMRGRLAAGATPAELVGAAAAYGHQQTAIGKVGSQYIVAPSRFFSKTGKWRGPFPTPPPTETAMDRLRRMTDPPSDNRVIEHEPDFGRFLSNG